MTVEDAAKALAVGVEAYQVYSHFHCLVGNRLPRSHRTWRGFGAAIVGDVSAYALACACLAAAGSAWWLLFLVPLLAHVLYGALLALAPARYARLHDHRLETIYADGVLGGAKVVVAGLDTALHVLAYVLLATLVNALVVDCAVLFGAAVYLLVFAARRGR